MTLRVPVVLMKIRKLTAREIAVSGVMAALMAVAAFIPVTVVVGVGKIISAAVILEPLIGVILGPILGTYAAATGAFVGQIVAPQGNIFHYLTFIPPTVGAATAGLLAHSRWKSASGVMVVVLLLWYLTSVGRELPSYPYMPAGFLLFSLVFRQHLGEWIHAEYQEMVGFEKTGAVVMAAGLSAFAAAQAVLFFRFGEVFTAGILTSVVAVIVLIFFLSKKTTVLKKVSVLGFFVGGVLLLSLVRNDNLIQSATAVLLCVTFFFFALTLLGRFSKIFLFSFALFGISAGIFMAIDTDNQILLQKITFSLILSGIFLFSLFHFQKKPLIRWSGLLFFVAGCTGLVQQLLLLSADSQLVKREFVNLGEIPFSTSVLGRELEITSVSSYYLEKAFPVYMSHLGFFLIFAALIILGVSFVLNVSVEKLAVAYFIIAGCSVFSDLMVGNFLAIYILGLKTGIFKAYLFIYPVERILMAFFSTIFGIGVLIPLKKYGLNRMFRR